MRTLSISPPEDGLFTYTLVELVASKITDDGKIELVFRTSDNEYVGVRLALSFLGEMATRLDEPSSELLERLTGIARNSGVVN